jgi:uncharacterized protein DUF3618
MSRRTEKLEQNVERSRERLSATLDELRSRMQPSTLRQEGSAYLTNTGAGQFVTNLKADALGNPVPLALLGIAVAWLASADRSSQPPVSIGRYTIMARWWARRLTQSAQKNASKTLSTVQSTRSAAGELQQRAREVSRNLSDQLSRAPDQVRGVAQRLARSTTTRANAISDVTRRHPLLVGTAAAGLAVSAVGLTLLYRRCAGELDAASRLVEASEEEAHSEALTSVPEATLVPHDFPNALEDLPVTSGAGQ